MSQASPTPPNLERQMVKGSAWMIAIRWGARALGLVSTIFLARLLTPADFGIVTIGMIILGTIETLNQTGQHLAIIRHPNPTREHYDSAWTIFVILSTTLAIIVFLSAPVAVIYFHEPRAETVVRILALKTFISGFENVGIIDFQKHLKFHKQFLYRLLPSVTSFVVTLAAAFILKNYWALVAGIVVQEFAGFVLSYAMSSFRPRLYFGKVRELWSFSVWTFVRNIAGYLGNQVDKLAIGGFAGAAAMGRYEVAADVATSPSQEINNPMLSVLFPVMATAQGDRQKLRELYLTVLYWSILICSSTAVGVALVADDMVDVVLGAKWGDIKPLMPWLALAYGLGGPSSSIIPVFDTLNKPHISARIQWSAVGFATCCVVFAAFYFHSLMGIVLSRFVGAVVFLPVIFTVLAREIQLRGDDFFEVTWRPALASAAMAAAVLATRQIMAGGALRLTCTVVEGAIVYGGTLMLAWYLVGRPDGPEKTLFEMVRRLGSRSGKHTGLIGEIGAGSGRIHRRRD